MNAPIGRSKRPKKRGECAGGVRPCPWVGCRYHLYLDVSGAGSVKLNFPDLEVWDLEETCALDVADDAETRTLLEVAEVMGVTRERVRQIEGKALGILSMTQDAGDWGVSDRMPQARALWQGRTTLALSMGLPQGGRVITMQAGRTLKGHMIEELDGLYRAIKRGEEAPMVRQEEGFEEAAAVGMSAAALGDALGVDVASVTRLGRHGGEWGGWVFARSGSEADGWVYTATRKAQAESAGDPEWLTTREMAKRARLTAQALKYRLDKGLPVNGHELVRRLDPTCAGKVLRYQWALVPLESEEVEATGSRTEATRIRELETQLTKKDEEAREAHAYAGSLRQELDAKTADGEAAAKRIKELEEDLKSERELRDTEEWRVRDMREKTTAQLKKARLEVEAAQARIATLEAAPVATLEHTASPDVDALHRILGGLDVLAWMVEHSEPEAVTAVVVQLGEILETQLGT